MTKTKDKENPMTAKEQLLKAIEQVPDPLLEEVLDFLLFIQSRHNSKPIELSTDQPRKRQWSQRFLSTFGSWQGEPLERAPQGEQPERDELL
jgi:hypothetical protein